MHKRIYRFEIVEGVTHATYLARDTARDAESILFEWTPPAKDLERHLSALGEMKRSPEFEIFSTGASLYLAAPTEKAADEGLRRLREAGLFQGSWTTATTIAPPPPPPLPPPPIIEAASKSEQKGNTWILSILIVLVLVLMVALLIAVSGR